MRVLLIEPYFGGSHRAWAEGYAAASSLDVDMITMPARWWKWRMYGAAVTLARRTRAWMEERGRPDVLLVSDMVDLAALRGLAGHLAGVPVCLYMHENQLVYPTSPDDRFDRAYPFLNWRSMVAADLVAFNSEYHFESWWSGLPALLRNFPDLHEEDLIAQVKGRSVVLPVGVDLARIGPPGPRLERREEPPLVLWNQRWEHDKDPPAFFTALAEVADRETPFRLALCGENFRQQPAEFQRVRTLLGDRIVQFGLAEAARYLELLREADVVVSTARHEFFGIGVVEAMYAGAFPVLPDRLSYPELLAEEVDPRCLYQDPAGLVERLDWALRHPGEASSVAAPIARAMARFDWSAVAPRYDQVLASLARSPRP